MFSKQINVKTRCPECHTEYPLVPAALKATRGVARCAKCGHVFNAFDHRVSETEGAHKVVEEQIHLTEQTSTTQPGMVSPEAVDSVNQPMFADDVMRHQGNSKLTARIWQIPLLLLLGMLLLAQIAWLNRAALLRMPQAQPLCQWVDCSVAEKRAPESFQVIEREIRHDPFQQDVLHFSLRFRNDAAFAQPLPELLLHLFDDNEYLVARRRLAPHEYLPDTATAGIKVQPREIINVQLAFMDPGAHASGFRIDFF